MSKFSDLDIISYQTEGQASSNFATSFNQIEDGEPYLEESNQWSGNLPSFDEEPVPTRFDRFDHSPVKSEFHHNADFSQNKQKLPKENKPSWMNPTPQPKIKFSTEPMNYDDFKSR